MQMLFLLSLSPIPHNTVLLAYIFGGKNSKVTWWQYWIPVTASGSKLFVTLYAASKADDLKEILRGEASPVETLLTVTSVLLLIWVLVVISRAAKRRLRKISQMSDQPVVIKERRPHPCRTAYYCLSSSCGLVVFILALTILVKLTPIFEPLHTLQLPRMNCANITTSSAANLMQMDILLNQMEGNPNLQEAIRAVTGEVSAMMADPLVQERSTLLIEQLEKVMADANFQEQAKQLLEQAKGAVMQMQTMMMDPRLQGQAEMLAKQIQKGMMADGNEEAMEEVMEAVEAIMANPIYQEYTRRLIDQLEAMKANQNFPGLATPIAQFMKTLMADPNFQSHARRIANVLITSQSTDGGSSLAEVGRSGSGVAFLPRSLFKRRPVDSVSRPAASQHLRCPDHSCLALAPKWTSQCARTRA